MTQETINPERLPVISCSDLAHLDEFEVVDGYRDGLDGFPCGANRSRSYWHGWRKGMLDGHHRESEWDDAALARDYSRNGAERVEMFRKMFADDSATPPTTLADPARRGSR